MADLSKLKKPRRNSLGAPPPPEEASQNLSAPETAPSAPSSGAGEGVAEITEVVPLRSPPVALAPQPEIAPIALATVPKKAASTASPRKRIDGRTLRKTGRTLPFSTRVSEAWDEKLRIIAQRDELNFAELLEKALDAYETARK